jgi:hypothetical protein
MADQLPGRRNGHARLPGQNGHASGKLDRGDLPPRRESLDRPPPRLPSPGATAGADRRQFRRLDWRPRNDEQLRFEVEEPGEAWRPIPCTIVDLGAGGMGVLAEEPISPGSRVRVTFALPAHLEDGAQDVDINALLAVSRVTALGEVVHARQAPEHVLAQAPGEGHHAHHQGVRFRRVEGDGELRLLRALYGPLPEGWTVERQVRHDNRVSDALPAASVGDTTRVARPRYAVLRHGTRVAQGFATYERARQRAWSLHMDEVATRQRRRFRADGVS